MDTENSRILIPKDEVKLEDGGKTVAVDAGVWLSRLEDSRYKMYEDVRMSSATTEPVTSTNPSVKDALKRIMDLQRELRAKGTTGGSFLD